MDSLIQGITMAFTPINSLWIVVGVILGMIGGTLPGISGSMMIAVLLPIMYKMPISAMTMAIIGIYAASVYSGGTAGILYNIPGDAPGIPTTIEGYRLTLKGKTREALSMAASASLFGNTFGVACMIVLIPAFVYIITFFGAAERAMFGIWALVLVSVGVLTREDPLKGMVGMGIGLIFGTVGTQANVGGIRFVQGAPVLWDGFYNLWVILGIYAIPQLMRLPRLKYILDKLRDSMKGQKFVESPKDFYGLGFSQIKDNIGIMFKGATLGTIVGIIPGIGAMTSGFLALAMSKRFAKHPELVGQGSLEAIACIESANNAAVPGTLIPMFSLGIPGNGTSAMILSMFIMAGLYPGPQMMQQNGDLVWCIVTGCFITGTAFWVLAYPFRLGAGNLVRLPIHWMVAIMGPLIMLGAYMSKNSFPGGNIAFFVALLSIFAAWAGIPVSGILLGNLLCRNIEVDLIRAYKLDGLPRFVETAPLIMIVVILATLGLGVYNNYFAKHKDGANAVKMVGQGDNDIMTDSDDNIMELDEEQKRLSKEKRKDLEKNKDVFTRFLSALLALFVAVGVLVQLPSFVRLAQIWPGVVVVIFLLVPGLILLAQALFQRERIARFLRERAPMSAKTKKDVISGWGIFVILVICFNLCKVIGFIEGCALFAFLVIMYLYPKKFVQAVLAFILIAALIGGMKYGFNFLLPRGPLGI